MNILYNTVGIVTLKTRATSVGNAVKNFASSSIGIIFVYHAYKKKNPNNPLKIKKLSINTDFGGGGLYLFLSFYQAPLCLKFLFFYMLIYIIIVLLYLSSSLLGTYGKYFE